MINPCKIDYNDQYLGPAQPSAADAGQSIERFSEKGPQSDSPEVRVSEINLAQNKKKAGKHSILPGFSAPALTLR